MDRRFKIHKRRVDLLEYPLKELSPNVYMLICRQLMYELGEIYESMMDAKLDKLKELHKEHIPPNAQVNDLFS